MPAFRYIHESSSTVRLIIILLSTGNRANATPSGIRVNSCFNSSAAQTTLSLHHRRRWNPRSQRKLAAASCRLLRIITQFSETTTALTWLLATFHYIWRQNRLIRYGQLASTVCQATKGYQWDFSRSAAIMQRHVAELEKKKSLLRGSAEPQEDISMLACRGIEFHFVGWQLTANHFCRNQWCTGPQSLPNRIRFLEKVASRNRRLFHRAAPFTLHWLHNKARAGGGIITC